MSVIDILVEPARVTRILFDCHEADPDSVDQRRIEQAIKESPYLARADENDSVPDAAGESRGYSATCLW
jgi:hypothetical protein